MAVKIKEPLQEFVNSELNLLEETSETGRPKFKGLFQKCNEENRNKRIYSKKLWEQTLTSPEIKKKLEKRTMLGELNHPEYRDPNPENASHVVTKLWLSEDNVYGEAEILDTPKGRILEALLKANVQIGVSSRGEGQMVERHGKKFVDEESYKLITFDTVLEPSVEESTASLIETKFGMAMTNMLNEGKLGSSEISILGSLTEQFSDEEIAESLKAQILEAKNKIETKPKKSEKSSMSTDEQLLDRLNKANETLSEKKEELVLVNEQNKSLRNQIAQLKTERAKFIEDKKSLSKTAEKVEGLEDELNETKLKLDKSIQVIEGMKTAFDKLREQKTKLEGFYQKALGVLEGVTEKINSTKVEDFLDEQLQEFGGIKRFGKILGNVGELSLQEARERVDEIKNLIDEGTVRKSPLENTSSLRLREGKSKDSKTPTRRVRRMNEREDKGSVRASMSSILDQV